MQRGRLGRLLRQVRPPLCCRLPIEPTLHMLLYCCTYSSTGATPCSSHSNSSSSSKCQPTSKTCNPCCEQLNYSYSCSMWHMCKLRFIYACCAVCCFHGSVDQECTSLQFMIFLLYTAVQEQHAYSYSSSRRSCNNVRFGGLFVFQQYHIILQVYTCYTGSIRSIRMI